MLDFNWCSKYNLDLDRCIAVSVRCEWTQNSGENCFVLFSLVLARFSKSKYSSFGAKSPKPDVNLGPLNFPQNRLGPLIFETPYTPTHPYNLLSNGLD